MVGTIFLGELVFLLNILREQLQIYKSAYDVFIKKQSSKKNCILLENFKEKML